MNPSGEPVVSLWDMKSHVTLVGSLSVGVVAFIAGMGLCCCTAAEVRLEGQVAPKPKIAQDEIFPRLGTVQVAFARPLERVPALLAVVGGGFAKRRPSVATDTPVVVTQISTNGFTAEVALLPHDMIRYADPDYDSAEVSRFPSNASFAVVDGNPALVYLNDPYGLSEWAVVSRSEVGDGLGPWKDYKIRLTGVLPEAAVPLAAGYVAGRLGVLWAYWEAGYRFAFSTCQSWIGEGEWHHQFFSGDFHMRPGMLSGFVGSIDGRPGLSVTDGNETVLVLVAPVGSTGDWTVSELKAPMAPAALVSTQLGSYAGQVCLTVSQISGSGDSTCLCSQDGPTSSLSRHSYLGTWREGVLSWDENTPDHGWGQWTEWNGRPAIMEAKWSNGWADYAPQLWMLPELVWEASSEPVLKAVVDPTSGAFFKGYGVPSGAGRDVKYRVLRATSLNGPTWEPYGTVTPDPGGGLEFEIPRDQPLGFVRLEEVP